MSISAVQLVDQMWDHYKLAINLGITNDIVVPVGLKNRIGKQGIDDITVRFSQFVQANTTSIEDAAHNVTIKHAHDVYGDRAVIAGGPKPKYAPAKKSKLPRPPNAFILYRQHHHPLVKAEHPELHNTQISIVLGNQWKHESDATKTRFQNMAEVLKRQHFQEHPDYQYQPRKSADRKRRMTRHRIAASNVSTLLLTGPALMTSAPAEPAVEVPPPLPNFAKTDAGNVILDIGHEDLEHETFMEMLNEYNKTVQPMLHQVGQANVNGCSAVLSTGVSQEAFSEGNHFSSLLDWNDELKSCDELAADMELCMKGATTTDKMWAAAGFAETPSATFDGSLDQSHEHQPEIGHSFMPEVENNDFLAEVEINASHASQEDNISYFQSEVDHTFDAYDDDHEDDNSADAELGFMCTLW